MDGDFVFGLTLADVLLHVSYLFLVIGSLVRKILALRVLIIISCIAGLISGAVTEYSAMVLWEAGFLLVNVVQVAIILHERNTIRFTEEEQLLYNRKFSTLTPVEFNKLIKIASWITTDAHVEITTQGAPVSRIVIIAEGTAQVVIDGTIVAYCTVGDFIGEMAFVSGNPASATVSTITPTRYLMWRFEELQGLLSKHPDIRNSLQTVFSKNLVEKLTRESIETAPVI